MRRRTVLKGGLAAAMAVGLQPQAAFAEDIPGCVLYRLRLLRQTFGLPILFEDRALTEMARRQAMYMLEVGHVTYKAPDGSGPPVRARQAGYAKRLLGEALAETWTGAAKTVDHWLDHERTRAVLLDPAAREIGVSGFRDDAGILRLDCVTGTDPR